MLSHFATHGERIQIPSTHSGNGRTASHLHSTDGTAFQAERVVRGQEDDASRPLEVARKLYVQGFRRTRIVRFAKEGNRANHRSIRCTAAANQWRELIVTGHPWAERMLKPWTATSS